MDVAFERDDVIIRHHEVKKHNHTQSLNKCHMLCLILLLMMMGKSAYDIVNSQPSTRNKFSIFRPATSTKSTRSTSAQVPPTNQSVKYFSVIGATPDPTYLFPLLITVLQWRKIGAESILCFSNSPEDYNTNEGIKFIMDQLRAENVQMVFLPTSMAPPHTVSQTCRLFVAASKEIEVSDTDILITTDADLWVFKLNDHIPKPGQEIFLYNSECCWFVNKLNSTKKFRMYPMSTIAMSAKLWKTIMNTTDGWLQNGDVLAQRLYDEFNSSFIRLGRPKPNLTESWATDQLLVSEKIYDYKKTKKPALLKKIIGRKKYIFPRIDRSMVWPTKINKAVLSVVSDAHILTPLYTSKHWNDTRPLLKLMFNKKEMEKLDNYRNTFVSKWHNITLDEEALKILQEKQRKIIHKRRTFLQKYFEETDKAKRRQIEKVMAINSN